MKTIIDTSVSISADPAVTFLNKVKAEIAKGSGPEYQLISKVLDVHPSIFEDSDIVIFGQRKLSSQADVYGFVLVDGADNDNILGTYFGPNHAAERVRASIYSVTAANVMARGVTNIKAKMDVLLRLPATVLGGSDE